jgi:hypothetical protein
LVWSPCFRRTSHLPLTASPCSRLSRPQSNISQSDFRQVIGSSLPNRLVGPYKLRLNLTALPCSHKVLRSHAGGTNPGSISGHSLYRIQRFRLPHRGIGSATPITIDFGAIFPFTDVPAYDLLVYASQCHTSHHARLGTRLPAKLCCGHHFRQLNFMSFQGATPHRSVRALLRIRLPPCMSSEKANHRIRMQNAWSWKPPLEDPEGPVPRHASLTAAMKNEPPQAPQRCPKRLNRSMLPGTAS